MRDVRAPSLETTLAVVESLRSNKGGSFKSATNAYSLTDSAAKRAWCSVDALLATPKFKWGGRTRRAAVKVVLGEHSNNALVGIFGSTSAPGLEHAVCSR